VLCLYRSKVARNWVAHAGKTGCINYRKKDPGKRGVSRPVQKTHLNCSAAETLPGKQEKRRARDKVVAGEGRESRTH